MFEARPGESASEGERVRELYPEIEPYRVQRLKVSDVHELYVEESGNAAGLPVVFVHGGPGGATVPKQRRLFDPAAYRIILFDQRGCGRSTPYSSLEENTTWDLVADMEKIREQLGIERWTVFGGSWGSTLSLAYAEAHSERVVALVLRGIFLVRPHEIHWFYQEGANYIYPDAWRDFLRPIPEAERGDLVAAYRRRLTADDAAVRREAAIAWSVWEASVSRLIPDAAAIEDDRDPHRADALARIENHYFVNRAFFDSPDQLLDGVDRIRHIPATIVQGRYDICCPMTSAWDLHERWPEARFEIVADAGHSAMEPGIAERLIDATDRLRATTLGG